MFGDHNPMTKSCGVMTYLPPSLHCRVQGRGDGRKLGDDGVRASLSFTSCLYSPVLNYLFEQIIVVEDKLKEEVESEKNF